MLTFLLINFLNFFMIIPYQWAWSLAKVQMKCWFFLCSIMEHSRLLFLDSFRWDFPLKIGKLSNVRKNRTVCLNQWNARKYSRRQKLANRAQSSCDKAPEKSCWLPAVVRLRRLLLKLWTSFYDRKCCCFGLVSCLGYLVNLYVQLPRTSTCMKKKIK